MTTGGSHAAGPERPDVEGRTAGELISEVASDFSTLMRQELDLAKVEMKAEASKAAKAGGMLGGAGLAGHFVLIFLSLTLMWALADAFDSLIWASLVVAILWGIIAAVLFVLGKKKMSEVSPKPERTVQTLKEDAEWARTRNS